MADQKQPSKLKGQTLEPKYKDPATGKTWGARKTAWVIGTKSNIRFKGFDGMRRLMRGQRWYKLAGKRCCHPATRKGAPKGSAMVYSRS